MRGWRPHWPPKNSGIGLFIYFRNFDPRPPSIFGLLARPLAILSDIHVRTATGYLILIALNSAWSSAWRWEQKLSPALNACHRVSSKCADCTFCTSYSEAYDPCPMFIYLRLSRNFRNKSTVPMTNLQPIICFVPASQANSKFVSRNAAILFSNFFKNLTSRKIIKIIPVLLFV